MPDKLAKLRTIIQESLRVQRGAAEQVSYIDTGTVLADASTRQNHVIFARRGCGKTLLLQYSSKHLPSDIKTVYLNCEDYKRHSFPNVLIEILDSILEELETHLTGWFSRKRKSRELIKDIRRQLDKLRKTDDVTEEAIKATSTSENGSTISAGVGAPASTAISASVAAEESRASKYEVEKTYQQRTEKLAELDRWLPKLKSQLRDFFQTSSNVRAIFLQIDDLYHLRKEDQPFVIDYVHRLCKDVPIFFKVATLRHASVLFIDRNGQPYGAQERHDYQPIDIDYTFRDFPRTCNQNKKILYEFGKLAGFTSSEIDSLFKGEGFERLVLAGGGVPRDTLSLFLAVLSSIDPNHSDLRIGKDEVRALSKSNFEHRIEELKQDSHAEEQGPLIKATYAIREFCLEKKTNVFLVAERILQQNDQFRHLIYRLLDYRIIHSGATAITHKSHEGAYQAFAIDMGCYAHYRKLAGKLNEIDFSAPDAKERLRSAPILDLDIFNQKLLGAPSVIAELEDEAIGA